MINKELLEYFNGDELAASAWLGKYALEGEQTPDDMHKRMAKEFARIEKHYTDREKVSSVGKASLSDYGRKRENLTEDKIYNFFKDFKYIVPQGSIMSMLGNPKIGSLSNCFVIGQPHDSYGGIMQKEEEMVQLMKRRGGVGLDLSTLRPAGTETNNAAKTSTGMPSFMERYSQGTREVAQDGRRGALMLTVDVRHPDVLGFINSKQDRSKVTGANISVMLRDDFMEAVKNDGDYILRFPCDLDISKLIETRHHKYNSLYEYTCPISKEKGYIKKVKAKEIYDAIVENAHDNAEPGQMFIDRHWDYSPDGVYEQYRGVTTNPCGEIFMQPYDACRLMALNLFSFVENPFTDKAYLNKQKLYQMAYEQQRLADDLVDLELEHITRILAKLHTDPEPDEVKRTEIELWKKIYDVCKSGRRTGCGFTALGDCLAALGIKYDSEDGKTIIKEIMGTKALGELDCTIDLAILRGTFDGWDRDKEWISDGHGGIPQNSFYEMLDKNFSEQFDRMLKYGRRNVSWSTVAPTGTVSLMTQTSSGLEPLFKAYYIRRKKVNPSDKDARVDFTDQNGDKWQEFAVLHPKFKEWMTIQTKGDWNENTPKEYIQAAFEKSPWYGSEANDIDWIERVKIQGIIQKYTSHSISSTINLPEDVTTEEVSKIYLAAYEEGLKGVTIYREGSRTGVLVSDNAKDVTQFTQNDAPKRPKELKAEAVLTTVKGEKYTVFVGLLDEKPYETFALHGNGITGEGTITKKKKGEYVFTSTTKEEQKLLTDGMSDEEAAMTRLISTSLRHGAKIDFVVEQLRKTHGDLTSFSKAIARVLSRYEANKEVSECPECKTGKLIRQEGCISCSDCSYSKC